MDDLSRVADSVDQLRQVLSGWDWNAFLSTLIATVAGAALAGGVAWRILRRQRRDQYEARMADAARTTFEAILSYAEHRTSSLRTPTTLSPFTSRAVLELTMLKALSDREDKKITGELRELFREIQMAPIASSGLAVSLGGLVSGLSTFIARESPIADQLDALQPAWDAVP